MVGEITKRVADIQNGAFLFVFLFVCLFFRRLLSCCKNSTKNYD